jgi:hypothetical protein
VTNVEIYPVLKVNVPELYEDPAFVAWLNDPDACQATWHKKGEDPHEYSDVFVWFDHGDGSDSVTMPGACWDRLVQLMGENHLEHGLIWLTNLEVIAERRTYLSGPTDGPRV